MNFPVVMRRRKHDGSIDRDYPDVGARVFSASETHLGSANTVSDLGKGLAPLRIGVLLDGYIQPVWVRDALERMLKTGSARIVAVAVNQQEQPATAIAKGSRLARWIKNREGLLHAVHTRLDRWKFSVRESPFTPVDITSIVGDAAVIPVIPRQTAYSDYFPADAVDALRACDLDVAVRFGFRILRGDALRIARHGVWSYHHGDKDTKRGGPPAYWEVLEPEPTTGAVLQVLSEDLDDGRVLVRGWVRTNRFSTWRNSSQLYWMAEPFLARAVTMLASEPPVSLQPEANPSPAFEAYSDRLYRRPANKELRGPLVRLARRYVSQHLRYARMGEQWYIAYNRQKLRTENLPPELAPFRYQKLLPPAGWCWADPFPARVNGRDYLFFEEYLYANKKGRIAVSEFGDDGKPRAPTVILDLPYHQAYPFHFSYGGEEYLMPECGTRNAVEVWRARKFPGEWNLEHSMLEGSPWVDASLIELKGQWVLFTGLDTSARGDWDELHIFFSDSPFGPWRPHRRNPVVVDVRSARPAGRPFHSGGRLIRPAQDGTHSYGYGLRFQEVVRLTETEYEERTVTQLLPRWEPGLVGSHTFNHIPGFTAIDVRRLVPRSQLRAKGS